MKVRTLLRRLAASAELNARSCDDADKFSNAELFEINTAIAALQNHLGDVQDLFDETGRKIEVWRG